MQRRTSAGAKRLCALLPRGRFVPVGDAFRDVYEGCARRRSSPEHDDATLFSRLYAPDRVHPSRLGTYLAACCFYAALTGASPEGHAYRPPPSCPHDDAVDAAFNCLRPGWSPAAMSEDDAAELQAAAARATVYLRAELRRARGGLRDPLDSDGEDAADSDDDDAGSSDGGGVPRGRVVRDPPPGIVLHSPDAFWPPHQDITPPPPGCG